MVNNPKCLEEIEKILQNSLTCIVPPAQDIMFSTEDSTLYMGVTYLSMPYTKSTSSSTTSGLTSAKITCLSFRGSRPRPRKIGNFTASSKLSTG